MYRPPLALHLNSQLRKEFIESYYRDTFFSGPVRRWGRKGLEKWVKTIPREYRALIWDNYEARKGELHQRRWFMARWTEEVL